MAPPTLLFFSHSCRPSIQPTNPSIFLIPSLSLYLLWNFAMKKPIVSELAFCRRFSGIGQSFAPSHASSGRNLCSNCRWSHDNAAPGMPADPSWGFWEITTEKAEHIQGWKYEGDRTHCVKCFYLITGQIYPVLYVSLHNAPFLHFRHFKNVWLFNQKNYFD